MSHLSTSRHLDSLSHPTSPDQYFYLSGISSARQIRFIPLRYREEGEAKMGKKKEVTGEEERWGILPRSQESIPSLLSSRWICLGAYAGAKGRRFPPCLCRRSRPQFPALEQRLHSQRGQVLNRVQI